MNKTIIKDSLALFIITLVAGVFLGLVYEVTKNPIAVQQEKTKQEAYQKVFSNAEKFIALEEFSKDKAKEILEQGGYSSTEITEVVVAYDNNDNKLGYVLNMISKEGYGGDINFTLGIQNDGTVNAIEILSISETAGLGMKAKDEAFKNQFSNKNVAAFSYTKTGASNDNEIDAISGATITTNAVTNTVNAGIFYFSILEGTEDGINE